MPIRTGRRKTRQNEPHLYHRPFHPYHGIDYIHLPQWAPDQTLLEHYKKKNLDFSAYEKKYLALLKHRNIEKTGVPQINDKDCLLCSEHDPAFCHRRLAAEYIKTFRPDMAIVHLQ